ncbi:hypothetical protein ACFQ9X_11290 [Catenulispora yoronensis]
MSEAPLYASYTITPDPTLPPNTFRWTMTAPSGGSGDYSCQLVDSTGAARGTLFATTGYPAAYSSADGFSGYPGNSLTARLNARGGTDPDIVVPLAFPVPLSSALNQKVVAFALSTQPVAVPAPAGGGARPLAELDPNGSPIVLSYDVPEPTSYRGRQIVQLDFPPAYFVGGAATTGTGGPAAAGPARGRPTSRPPTSRPPTSRRPTGRTRWTSC